MDSTSSLPVKIIGGLLLALIPTLLTTFIPTLFASPISVLYCASESHFITTLEPGFPQAKCFRVLDGLFTELLDEIPELVGEEEKIVTLDGYVIPGIIESHGHILQYGEMLESVALYDSKSVDEVISRIKLFLGEHAGEGYGSKEKWIRGIGWDQAYFKGVMPTAVCIPRS